MVILNFSILTTTFLETYYELNCEVKRKKQNRLHAGGDFFARLV